MYRQPQIPACRAPQARTDRFELPWWSYVGLALLVGALLCEPVAPQSRSAQPLEARLGRQAEDMDEGLRRAIDLAIRDGARRLVASQEPGGGWAAAGDTPIGAAALCGIALRRSGLGPADEPVRQARAFVLREIERNWVPARAMPAIDAFSAGLAIDFLLESGISRDHSAVVGSLHLLEDAYSSEGDWDVCPSWIGAARHERDGDVSTTLYAMYGLYAASVHGMTVDLRGPRCLLAALRERQEPDGSFSVRTDGAAHGHARVYTRFGSTCRALAAYVMAREVVDPSLLPGIAPSDDTLERGMAWVHAHAAAALGDDGDRDPAGLESVRDLNAGARLASLLRLDRLGGRPWLASGARLLVEPDAPEGGAEPRPCRRSPSTPPLQTAFTLLFLGHADAVPERWRRR